MAGAISSHALPVGTHIANCAHCPNAWRVLPANGSVSPEFRSAGASRTDTAEDVLRAEGVCFDKKVADPDGRLTLEELTCPLGE